MAPSPFESQSLEESIVKEPVGDWMCIAPVHDLEHPELDHDECPHTDHSPRTGPCPCHDDEDHSLGTVSVDGCDSHDEDDHVCYEQSPIDICAVKSDHVPKKGRDKISMSHKATNATLDYNGSNFHVVFQQPERNVLKIAGKTFHAIQFHFHTPSEHTFDGEHKPMECHLVHKAQDGSLAVVAVFFHEGKKKNHFLAQFWDKLANLHVGERAKIPLGRVSPRKLHMHTSDFFRYKGSLTTPPYSEGVEWIVLPKESEATREQLEMFRKVIPAPNARDIQPINKRHTRHVQHAASLWFHSWHLPSLGHHHHHH